MMDLEIDNCSEMERDFLVRYSNAAKSKSCVIVSLEDAEVRITSHDNKPLLIIPSLPPFPPFSKDCSVCF